MFHANAWGIAHAGPAAGCHADHARRRPVAGVAGPADRAGEGDLRRRRARPSGWACCRSWRSATSRRCAGDVRRLGAADVGGRRLRGGHRRAAAPGLGHDRDQPGRARSTSRRRRVAARRARATSVGFVSRASTSGWWIRRPARRSRGTTRTPASCRWPGPWIARVVLRRRALRRLLHRRRLAPHRRRRPGRRRGLRLPRRPHQGPREVRRRVDQLGRAGERDHGPPEGRRGRRDRRVPPEVDGAPAGRASCPRPARR